MLVVHPSSQCDVCLDPYNWSTPAKAPHAIQCGHIFCYECVFTSASQSRALSIIFSCGGADLLMVRATYSRLKNRRTQLSEVDAPEQLSSVPQSFRLDTHQKAAR